MRFIFKLILLGIVFGLTLEICARIDNKIKYNSPMWGRYSPDLLRTFDSDGIPRNVSNARFEKWSNNSLGFRGKEISLKKISAIIRIACMGTSESYGLYEQEGHEWPAQLGYIIQNDTAFEVVNTSVVGLSPLKYRAYIDKYVLNLSPDIVILLMSPCLYIIELERTQKIKDKIQVREQSRNQLKTSISEFINDLRILPKMIQALKKYIPPDILKSYQTWVSKKQVKSAENIRLKNQKPFDAITLDQINSYQSNMESLVRSLQEKNIKVILTSYPMLLTKDNINKYPDLFYGIRRFGVELSFEGMIDASNKLDQLNENIAIANGLGFVPLNQIIPKNEEYFADNFHLTDKGANLVASTFATFIKNNYLTK